MVVYRMKKGAEQVLTDYEHEFAHPLAMPLSLYASRGRGCANSCS